MRKKEEDEKIYKKKQEQKRKMAARLEKEHEKTLKKKNPTLFETQGEKDQKEYGRVFKERLQELELMAKDQLYID
jgi:DNA helicase TIP49 (TBP-interacting protein)